MAWMAISISILSLIISGFSLIFRQKHDNEMKLALKVEKLNRLKESVAILDNQFQIMLGHIPDSRLLCQNSRLGKNKKKEILKLISQVEEKAQKGVNLIESLKELSWKSGAADIKSVSLFSLEDAFGKQLTAQLLIKENIKCMNDINKRIREVKKSGLEVTQISFPV